MFFTCINLLNNDHYSLSYCISTANQESQAFNKEVSKCLYAKHFFFYGYYTFHIILNFSHYFGSGFFLVRVFSLGGLEPVARGILGFLGLGLFK